MQLDPPDLACRRIVWDRPIDHPGELVDPVADGRETLGESLDAGGGIRPQEVPPCMHPVGHYGRTAGQSPSVSPCARCLSNPVGNATSIVRAFSGLLRGT